MSKEVVWTKIILETFLEESGILDRIDAFKSHSCLQKKLTNFFHYVNMFMGKPNKVKPLFLKNLLHNHKRVGLIPTLLVS